MGKHEPAKNLLQQEGKIAPAKYHALYAHNLILDPKQNYISTDNRQPRIVANLRAKPVKQRILCNAANLIAYLPKELNRTSWIVLCDIVGNSRKIALDESRKLDAHYLLIALYFFSSRDSTSFGATPGASSLTACFQTRRNSFNPC